MKRFKKKQSSIINWITLLSFFVLVSTLNSCNDECDCLECEEEEEIEEEYSTLEVVNQLDDNQDRYISSVFLVNYDFENLNIEYGESQSFVLDQGMPAGNNDINIRVCHSNPPYAGNCANVNVNFVDGETTTVSLVGYSELESDR